MSNGVRPPESAEKSIAEVVGEVTEKASLLVREEIELAKVELQIKVSRFVRGAAAGAVGAFFALFALLFLLHALSWGISVLIGTSWSGFLVTGGLLLLAAALAAALAVRWVRRATPPKPELAIEEAKKTRAALEEARG